MEQEELRMCLKSMGVDSVGIYVHNGITCIAPHCDARINPENIKQFCSIYLPDIQILL